MEPTLDIRFFFFFKSISKFIFLNLEKKILGQKLLFFGYFAHGRGYENVKILFFEPVVDISPPMSKLLRFEEKMCLLEFYPLSKKKIISL